MYKDIKSRWLFTVVLILCCFPLSAQFKIGGSVGGSTDIYNGSFTKEDGEGTIENHSVFSVPNLGDTNLLAEFNWKDKAGFTIKLNAPTNLVSWGDKRVFDGTSGWINFGTFARIEAGSFERRKVNKVNDVVDEWNYGYIDAAGGLQETDVLRNLITDFYVGPVTLEFSFVNKSLDKAFFSFNEDISSPTNTFKRDLAGSGRVSVGVSDYVIIGASYTLGYAKISESQNRPSSTQPDEISFDNTYGGFVEVTMIPKMDLVFGYSGGIKKISKSSDVETVRGLTNLYHGVALRLGYDIIDSLRVESHNDFSFGSKLGASFLGMKWTEGGRPNSLAVWNALGIRYNVNDSLETSLIITNKWRKEYKDDSEQLYRNVLGIKPAVKWLFSEDIFVKIGISFSYDIGQETKKSVAQVKREIIQVSIPISFGVTF